MNRMLQPPSWARPRGYSNGVAARGTLVFVGGQIGWDDQHHFPSVAFGEQVRQALKNIVAIHAQAGAKPEHIVRRNRSVTDKRRGAYRSTGAVYRQIIGRHDPAMTAFEVAALIEDEANVEIEATAVNPDSTSRDSPRQPVKPARVASADSHLLIER